MLEQLADMGFDGIKHIQTKNTTNEVCIQKCCERLNRLEDQFIDTYFIFIRRLLDETIQLMRCAWFD